MQGPKISIKLPEREQEYTEAEVEELEDKVVDLLDAGDFDYVDVAFDG